MQATLRNAGRPWKKLLNTWPSVVLLAATILFTALPALSSAG
ncbi:MULTISPECIES: hypothetical protein [Microbulbifer]|nr:MULTISPECIES: hypothetical protein [Microbulbifer]